MGLGWSVRRPLEEPQAGRPLGDGGSALREIHSEGTISAREALDPGRGLGSREVEYVNAVLAGGQPQRGVGRIDGEVEDALGQNVRGDERGVLPAGGVEDAPSPSRRYEEQVSMPRQGSYLAGEVRTPSPNRHGIGGEVDQEHLPADADGRDMPPGPPPRARRPAEPLDGGREPTGRGAGHRTG